MCDSLVTWRDLDPSQQCPVLSRIDRLAIHSIKNRCTEWIAKSHQIGQLGSASRRFAILQNDQNIESFVPDSIPLPFLLLAFLLASMLYASVGHGGASAYLAVMGFAGMAPATMKPVALTLNIAVSAMALVMFARAGHFRWRLFWPLAVASVPTAFLGGWLQSPAPVFKLILAVALLFGAWRLAFPIRYDETDTREPQMGALVVLGAALGFLSGLIGIGGGIFLTPLLIFFRWSPAKPAAAISSAFIFANSLSGLGGFLVKGGAVPSLTWMLLPTVMIGGWLGANWGSRRAGSPALRRALAVVLVVAAAKFITI